MQYCTKCHVYIRGRKTCCPLCGGSLQEKKAPSSFEGDESPSFPVEKTDPGRSVSKVRILTFIMVLTEIAMMILAYETGRRGILLHWPYIVMVTAFLAWADLLIARYYRSNMIFLVTIEAYLGMAVCLAVDFVTRGFLSWSISWAVPAGFVALDAAVVLIGWSHGLHMVDYAVYILIATILSLLQLIPVLDGSNRLPLPACISMGLMLAYLAYIVIFRGRDLKNAAGKFWHM